MPPHPPRPRRSWAAALGLLLAACNSAPQSTPTQTPTPGPPPAPAAPPQLTLNGGDPLFGPQRLVFSRLHDNGGQDVVHDRATLGLGNTGAAPLHVTAVNLSPGWVLDPPISLPQTVAPGGSLSVGVRFVADQDPTQPPRLYSGSLTVQTDDPAAPARSVPLAGLWQATSERFAATNLYDEPSLELIRQTLGLNIRLSTPADAAPLSGANDGSSVGINQHGAVRPQGDEVLSGYWVAADPGLPVTVGEVGAWSGQGDSSAIGWYAKGDPTPHAIARRAAGSAQTLYPVSPDGGPVGGSFTPGGPFGLVVDGYEWSDPGLNDQNADRGHGCVNLCGQHLRFWPLTDAAGARVPNAYLAALDYQGINDDYQDELYVVRNVRPAPILIKVGASNSDYRSPDGQVWRPDRLANGDVTFDPPNAADEPGAPDGAPITGTDDPGLYRTYRGNVGDVPQNQRRLTFMLPIDNGSYRVRLHFADLAHTAPGQRVFDVAANGQTLLRNFDIVAAAGAGHRAVVEDLGPVPVTGGQLQLTLSASVDYPALSAIEIQR